jgi:hypothetical protein
VIRFLISKKWTGWNKGSQLFLSSQGCTFHENLWFSFRSQSYWTTLVSGYTIDLPQENFQLQMTDFRLVDLTKCGVFLFILLRLGILSRGQVALMRERESPLNWLLL